MLLEARTRDVLSNQLLPLLKPLFPKAPDEFFAANSHFANELARGTGEIVDAVSSAKINWQGPTKDAGVEKMFTKEFVRLVVTDGLVSGKLALFPRVDEQGVFRADALNGYLHPVFASGNALEVTALLQVLTVSVNDETRFEVRVYRPGMLEVYPPVSQLEDYARGTPEAYAQPHANDRLPVAFRIIRRDAHRRALGLLVDCLEPFLRYAKAATNRNAVQENAGWPERVVKSDRYLELAIGGDPDKPGQEHPAITALKKVAPKQLKLIGTGDDYDVKNGADPRPHIEAETIDKQALLDMLRSPDLSGGNTTGVALAERQSKSRALVTDLCDFVADVITEACTIADGLPQANIGTGITASLKPVWAVDRAARVSELKELFEVGALTKSMMLIELQSLGYTSITDEIIEATKAQEQEDLDPYLNRNPTDREPLPA